MRVNFSGGLTPKWNTKNCNNPAGRYWEWANESGRYPEAFRRMAVDEELRQCECVGTGVRLIFIKTPRGGNQTTPLGESKLIIITRLLIPT